MQLQEQNLYVPFIFRRANIYNTKRCRVAEEGCKEIADTWLAGQGVSDQKYSIRTAL